MKKIVQTTIGTIIFISLPTVVFMLITSKVSLFGIRSYVVLSGSMTPFLPVGSVIFTKEFPKYNQWDVVAFQSGDKTITHRIVEIQKNGAFMTKGDANNIEDAKPITQNMILGKEFLFVPFVGRFLMFLKTLPGLVAFIILPSLLFIGFELKNIKKEIEKEVEKKILKRIQTV